MKVLRPGMYEYEVVAEMNRVAESNNCELSFATIATINGQTLHNPTRLPHLRQSGTDRPVSLYFRDNGCAASAR